MLFNYYPMLLPFFEVNIIIYDFHMLIGTIDLFTVDKFYQIEVQGTCLAFFSLTCPLLLLNLRTGYGQTGWSMVIHKNSYHVTLGIVDISENFNCFSSV